MPKQMICRLLLCLLAFGFNRQMAAAAQEGSFFESLPPAQREAIGQASLYYESGELAKARDALRSIEHDPSTHPYVIMFAADMHDRLKEYDAALQDYDLVLKILGDDAFQVRWNIFLMRAKDLMELHRFADAVPALELALKHPAYKEGDISAYQMLATAYKEQKKYAEQRKALMVVLSDDPLNLYAWQDLGSLPPEAATGKAVPSGSSDISMGEVISYGFYGTWPTNDLLRRGKVYVGTAGKLVSENKTSAADNYLDCVAKAYLSAHGETAPSDSDELTIKRVMVVDELYDLSTLPEDLRMHLYYELIASNVALQQFRQALGAVQELAQIPTAQKDAPDIVVKISRLLFAYVSFDMKSGLPRRPTSVEFVGQNVGETLDEQAERELKNQVTGKSKAQEDPKYGSLNSREDWANLTSFEFLFEDKLKKIVEEQMQQGHFEVAVKLILVNLCLGGRPDFQSDKVIGIPISDIDKKISTFPNVPDETKEAYALAKNTASFLRELCSSHKKACE